MLPSHYLKTWPWPEDPGRILLFSTKKASLILLDRADFDALEEGKLDPAREAKLAALGMAVADREEERRSLLNLLDEQNPQNRGLHIVAVLNLDCNFACPYCFEEGQKGRLYMTGETAARLTAFLEEQWQSHKDRLRIDFYGGEPLLSPGLIETISRQARSFAAARNARYFFTVVTNGSLLTEEIAERLLPLGLESVRITLDGPAETHNRSRPFKSGGGSFERIIGNIKAVGGKVKIGIGGNFTRDNYRSFAHLLDYLEGEGLGPEKIASVRFDAVVNRPSGSTSPEYTGGCISIGEPWLLEAEAFLRGEILKRGYRTSKPVPLACMVETRDAYVVNYDGCLYKCPAMIGKKEFAVGSLEAGIRDYSETLRLGLYKNRTCADCEYLPMCYGGCRHMAYLRDGRIGALDCKREYFDAALETLLMQDIRYRLKK